MKTSPRHMTPKDLRDRQQAAVAKLIPQVYAELRRLAARYLRRERPDHTLQPTALVHEAYLRPLDQKNTKWKNREHFFGVAAQLMRGILLDYARGHKAAKRGGEASKIAWEESIVLLKECPQGLVALDEALNQLAAIDPQQARVVELRFFGGLTLEETAQVLGVSLATLKRDWSVAKAWLSREIRKEGAREARPVGED